MQDDEREKPPSNRDRMSDQADAAHEAAIARMQNDVHYANRFHALKAKATNPHDMVGYRVIRPVTQPVLNVQAETQADTRETETVLTEAVTPAEPQERHDQEKREAPGEVSLTPGSEAGAASLSPSPSSVKAPLEGLELSSDPHHETMEIQGDVVPRRKGSSRTLWIGVGMVAVMACGLAVLLWPRERGPQAKATSSVATMTPIESTSTAPTVKPGLTAEPSAVTTAEPATSIRKASPSSEKPQIKNPPSAPASAIPEASVSTPKPNNSTPAPSSKIPWYE